MSSRNFIFCGASVLLSHTEPTLLPHVCLAFFLLSTYCMLIQSTSQLVSFGIYCEVFIGAGAEHKFSFGAGAKHKAANQN